MCDDKQTRKWSIKIKMAEHEIWGKIGDFLKNIFVVYSLCKLCMSDWGFRKRGKQGGKEKNVCV